MSDGTRTRLLALSVCVGAAMLAASIILRPLWRDEYWALYFSGADMPLGAAIEGRMARDVHPPLYFILLHFLRGPAPDSMLLARLFNPLVLAAGAGAIWILGRARAAETAFFLALCATSYWVIYFGTEVRMYALLFAACATSVIAARSLLESKSAAHLARGLCIFMLTGAIASGSHYFGALWTASLGLCIGLGFLFAGRSGAFVATGLASIAAIVPVGLWILHAHPESKPGAMTVAQTMGEAFSYALTQFLRGLVVKTIGANIPAFAAAALAAPALARQKDRTDGALAGAVAVTVLIAFAVHVFTMPALIKERAFIVIMPALIYLCVRALGAIGPEQKIARTLAGLVPAAALISPFLFIPEYFKDREQLVIVRKAIEAAGDCTGAPVLVYYRPSDQAQDFHPFMIAAALHGATKDGGDLALLDAQKSPAPAYSPACRVRALALVLGKGETPLHATARETLARAGATLDRWEEQRLGKGRSLIWLAPVAGTPQGADSK